MQTPLSPLQLLSELDDLLRNVPERATIRHDLPENLAWLGRASALIELWNAPKGIGMTLYISQLHGLDAHLSGQAWTQILVLVQQAFNDLRLRTLGPVNVAVPRGMTFEYFDEIRKIISVASSDILFVDPYLDAEFISRYGPQIAPTASLRLLTSSKRMATLLPAVDALAVQSGQSISVRSVAGLHDRYLIVDRMSCYQSGASFKDGGRTAPTTLTQITDAFNAVRDTYEQLWSNGTAER